MVVVGSPQTVSGYRTESLGLLTDALVTFGLRLACHDRTMPFFDRHQNFVSAQYLENKLTESYQAFYVHQY